MGAIIEAFGLTKKFGNLIALNNVNIKVNRGSVFGFLGPNGAGKTTMVRVLNGILKPSAGAVRLFGEDISTDGELIRKRCGVQTDTNLYERLSAEENLQLWGELYGLDASLLKTRTDSLLRTWGLGGRGKDLVSNFSKGMKQKLAIARALIPEPEILFLDEPTAGLDPEASEELLRYLKKYVKGGEKTVFICSHRLEEMEGLCDYVAVINKGVILAEGNVEELKKKLWRENWFFVELETAKTNFTSMLKKESFVSTVIGEKNGIRVSLRNNGDIPKAVSALVQKGARILSVRKEEHTLKDLYFKLIPKENKQ